MRTKLFLLVVAAALTASGAAFAGNGHGRANARGHARLYAFVGKLTAAPGGGAVSIAVEGGNRAALRAMLGHSVDQTFSTGGSTEFLRWSRGIPTVVGAGDLAVGDHVRVNVRAPRGAALEQIERAAAGIVGDRGTQLSTPAQPLYLFRGRLTAIGSGSVTIDVRGGNARAMRLLLGQSASQTFATGEGTIFLLWQGKVPTVIDLAQLKLGDRVVVRTRAARGSSLAQVEATAARHVGDREPAAG